MTRDQQKALVSRFLSKCNEYALAKLADYQAELTGATAERALELQDKIGHWTAYRAFNEHAIDELKSDALDAWFDDEIAQK